MPTIHIKDLDSTEKGPGSDMSLYFKYTFVRLAYGKSSPEWVQYNGSDGDSHIFKGADGKLFKVDYNSPDAVIEWRFPTGWFNTKKSAIFCERQPKRQYLKGISSGHNMSFSTAETILTCRLKIADKQKDSAIDLVAQSKTFVCNIATVAEIFTKPQYCDFEEAYLSMKGKKAFSRAISEDFALLPHPQSKSFLVFCHEFPVAEVATMSKIKMLLPQFKSECSDFFQKEGITVV